jgi:cytochrome P450
MASRLAKMQLRIARESTMQRFRQVEVVGELKRIRGRFMEDFERLTVRVHPW